MEISGQRERGLVGEFFVDEDQLSMLDAAPDFAASLTS
jgi:hypothetical protein